MPSSVQSKTERAAYLGPAGSYSSLAAAKLCPQAQGVPCNSFYAAVELLKTGGADCAVLPVENTLQGAVTQNLDLLYANKELFAVREYVLPIEHRLIAREGTGLPQVRRVFSHRQAILQCGKFLAANLPRAELVETQSTAESLSHLTEEGDAGIVGAHVRAEGYAFLGGNIADEPKNFTHFLLVKKGRGALPKNSEHVYFAATCPHEPGALVKMLQILAAFDLNMTKIESRPIKNSPGEYCFFIEFKGDIAEPSVQAVVRRLEEYSKNFKLLGCY